MRVQIKGTEVTLGSVRQLKDLAFLLCLGLQGKWRNDPLPLDFKGHCQLCIRRVWCLCVMTQSPMRTIAERRSLDLSHVITLLPSAMGVFRRSTETNNLGLQNKNYFTFTFSKLEEMRMGPCVLLLPLPQQGSFPLATPTVAIWRALRIFTRGTFLGPF